LASTIESHPESNDATVCNFLSYQLLLLTDVVLKMAMIKTIFARLLPTGPFRSSQSVEATAERSTDIPLEDKLDPPSALPIANKKGGDGPVKREQLIKENIARFARLPASSVFEFVPALFLFKLCVVVTPDMIQSPASLQLIWINR